MVRTRLGSPAQAGAEYGRLAPAIRLLERALPTYQGGGAAPEVGGGGVLFRYQGRGKGGGGSTGRAGCLTLDAVRVSVGREGGGALPLILP